ncbi:MAG: DUF6125 family protein [Phascolarctobacterium sp.]|nr:DUF6125 family protein [Phascolarctobacterium sp.]
MKPEDMNQEQLAEFIIDMLHRMMVHHTLWFREVEHQLGFEKALKVMDYAWDKTKKISVQRMAQELGFEQNNGIPNALAKMPKDKQLHLLDAIAKNWLAQDGVWFQTVEFAHGMNDAKRCNDSTWSRFSLFEAWSVKKMLGLGAHPGLEGLEKALNFRIYGRLNVQTTHWEGAALVFEMNECRVQSARTRKGLEDYPCKSAGLVEYARFAEGIDDRIKTECIGCPPDKHPEEWHCAWRFTITE